MHAAPLFFRDTSVYVLALLVLSSSSYLQYSESRKNIYTSRSLANDGGIKHEEDGDIIYHGRNLGMTTHLIPFSLAHSMNAAVRFNLEAVVVVPPPPSP